MKKSRPGKPASRAKAPPPVAPRKARGATPNPRLAEQTRKVLGKHYASKYRTGRG
jgi:hypothetical protein